MYSVIDRYAADLKQLFTVVGKRIIQLTDIIHAAVVTSCSEFKSLSSTLESFF